MKAEGSQGQRGRPCGRHVRECLDTLIEHGTDRYGSVHAPILVSILDVDSRACPENPDKLDEYFRVTRRGRRSPAGSNLLTDQPLLKTMYLASAAAGEAKYADFANRYAAYVMENLVDEQGFFWWGWHRHYDVHRDARDGHNGSPHEIHALHCVAWDRLWEVNPPAVRREIEALWQWHVIDKAAGEVNRHGDGHRGCDFSMTAGALIEAFCFLHGRTRDRTWLDRARLLADYYWARREPSTDLIPERPNAGRDRFDGGSFTTSVTGLHCHSLLKAFEMTGEEVFRDRALAYLRAYARHGYDETTGRFWGALRLDGTPIPGPRVYTENVDSAAGYEAFQPRGHLNLWQPYVAGYEHPLSTAQVYAYAHQLTGDPEMLATARRFAAWIRATPPGTVEMAETWYRDYSNGPGRRGTYAEYWGRAISCHLHLYVLTGGREYLDDAQALADAAVAALWHDGLFRGHPAKPYYEAIDGVGYLLYALLALGETFRDPAGAARQRRVAAGCGAGAVAIPLDNW